MPVGFSKLAIIMNIDFIVTGIGFLVAYYFLIFKMLKSKKYSLLYLITPVLFAVGSVLVGVYQGGVPSEDGLHGLGARLSFLGGNLTLIISGVSLFKNRKGYSIVSIILGLIGLISAGFMNNALTNNLTEVVAIYERLTVLFCIFCRGRIRRIEYHIFVHLYFYTVCYLQNHVVVFYFPYFTIYTSLSDNAFTVFQ